MIEQTKESNHEKKRENLPLPSQDISIFDLPEWTGAPVTVQKTTEAFAGVRFQPISKIYHYRADGFEDLKVGDWVIVDSARGRQMAQVATRKVPNDNGVTVFRRIERKATGRDMAMRHFYHNKELEAMIACRAESATLALPIKIVKADYSFDGQTLIFSFSGNEENKEVDVSSLYDTMSRLYSARVEFRQIGPREVAKILGGMGACGIEERCCSKFLSEFSPITIKHAKEQNISLNPADITGMCGRLRCCLVYEFEQYVEAKRHMPKLKSMIGTPQGVGKVIEHLALRDSVKVLITEGDDRRELIFHREQLVPLEEYQRLQDKALSGKCDKHDGGGCDCGKDKSSGQSVGDTSSASAKANVGDGQTRGEPRREDTRRESSRRESSRRDDLHRETPRRDQPRGEFKRPDKTESNRQASGTHKPTNDYDELEGIETVSMADELGIDLEETRPEAPRESLRRDDSRRDDSRRDQRRRDDSRRDDSRRDDRNRQPSRRDGSKNRQGETPQTTNSVDEKRKPLRRRSDHAS
jgi:cell fate regulator YaaT (PSP1 superfamily)